jgi:hypothetical protein
MGKLIFSIFVLLLIQVVALAQDWQPFAHPNGFHRVEVLANGITPDGPATTGFAIQCYPGRNGYVAFDYIVRDASKIKKFYFIDFDGKGASTTNKRLVDIRVRTNRGDIVAKVSVSGGATDMNDSTAFVFTFGIVGQLRGDMKRLINAIRRGGSMISVTVRDNRYAKRTIHTDFPTQGASKAVTEILRRCGR